MTALFEYSGYLACLINVLHPVTFLSIVATVATADDLSPHIKALSYIVGTPLTKISVQFALYLLCLILILLSFIVCFAFATFLFLLKLYFALNLRV